jgi:threonine dehydratase
LFNLDDLERAQSLIYRHMRATPQLRWPLLCEALGVDVWVKHENHTPIGAFKVRGGLVYLDESSRHGRGPLVTATRGNHGQSIPFAARLHGREVHVFVPRGNSSEKNAAMRGWGAELHVHGRDFDASREAAETFAGERGLELVPSFHERLVRGVASYGLELFGEIDDLDTVYVPIGMGSGACSLVLVRDLLGLETEIVGVVSTGADAIARSFEAGRIIETSSAQTFADGVATRVPHPDAFAILKDGLARVVRVSDDEVAEAMRLLYRTTHNVAEGAGAAATAALAQERRQLEGRRVAVVLTGGNIDMDWYSAVLAGGTPTILSADIPPG